MVVIGVGFGVGVCLLFLKKFVELQNLPKEEFSFLKYLDDEEEKV
jgi:hypothetical protein